MASGRGGSKKTGAKKRSTAASAKQKAILRESVKKSPAQTLGIRRITIVTAAFIVAYTLAISINSFFYDYDPGYYGEYIYEEESTQRVEAHGYMGKYFCRGGHRSQFCR